MKCPKCNGVGFVPTNVFGVNGAIKCDFCDGTGVFITNAVEPMTNEEWFCGLSTEEKAKFLEGLITYCFGIGHITESEHEKYKELIDDVEKWLKSPHKE